MNRYLMPVAIAVVISLAAYGIMGSFKGFSTTGLGVGVQPGNNSSKVANENQVYYSGKLSGNAMECQGPCDDNDSCTSDVCNEKTGWSCVHEHITGCCELGRAYCDDKCVPVRCIVDKDCDDGLGYTDDKCVDPNGCNSTCAHTLIQNICGNGICEGGENYSGCPKDCGFLAPASDSSANSSADGNASVATNANGHGRSLKAIIITDSQSASAGDNITVTVHITDGSNPIPNATLNVSVRYPNSSYVRYPSPTNKKVQNYTDENGIFAWIFHSPSDKNGTFNASVAASGDEYGAVYNYTLFSVVNSAP